MCLLIHNTFPNPLVHTPKLFLILFEFVEIFEFESDLPECHPLARIKTSDVAPPPESDPTVWPHCGIEPYGVAPPAGLSPYLVPDVR